MQDILSQIFDIIQSDTKASTLEFSFYEQLKFLAQLSWAGKKFYNLGAMCH